MPAFNRASFQDRQKSSAEAKKALLEKFKARPPADDPAVMERAAQRQEIALAREARAAEKEARLRAEAAERARLEAEKQAALQIRLKAMEEAGFSMEGQTPKIMTAEMVEQADKIISMGCGVDAEACPARFILTEDWGLDDPAGQPIDKVREIRDQIRTHVRALLSEISHAE